jgi:hypothetical protein
VVSSRDDDGRRITPGPRVKTEEADDNDDDDDDDDDERMSRLGNIEEDDEGSDGTVTQERRDRLVDDLLSEAE